MTSLIRLDKIVKNIRKRRKKKMKSTTVKTLAIITAILFCLCNILSMIAVGEFIIGYFIEMLAIIALMIAVIVTGNLFISMAVGVIGFFTPYIGNFALVIMVITLILSVILIIIAAKTIIADKDNSENVAKTEELKKELLTIKKQLSLVSAGNLNSGSAAESQGTTSKPVTQTSAPIVSFDGEKQIVKTKILDTKERETAASKKKGRWARAFASGLTAGVGGGTFGSMYAGNTAAQEHARNAKMETVVTFLVIYSDQSRETVETIKGDDKYNEYIMYLE